MYILHTCWSLCSDNLVLMLDGQLGYALDVISRQQIVVERVILPIKRLVTKQLILLCPIVELYIIGKVQGYEILVPCEGTRLDVLVIQGRVPERLIDLAQCHRASAPQHVNDIQAFL